MELAELQERPAQQVAECGANNRQRAMNPVTSRLGISDEESSCIVAFINLPLIELGVKWVHKRSYFEKINIFHGR